jgi:hypothetical protein
MSAVDEPVLSVGDIFQLKHDYGFPLAESHFINPVYLVIRVLGASASAASFTFLCLNTKTLKWVTEYQFADDVKVGHPFIILLKNV